MSYFAGLIKEKGGENLKRLASIPLLFNRNRKDIPLGVRSLRLLRVNIGAWKIFRLKYQNVIYDKTASEKEEDKQEERKTVAIEEEKKEEEEEENKEED